MKAERYTLRQVVELTGISEFTLRAWENRYRAFAPDHSDTGRRQYSALDLQKAIILRDLLKRGFRIGEIASFSAAKLRALQGQDNGGSKAEVSAEVKSIMNLAVLQEWDGIERHLARITRKRRAADCVWGLFLPLLAEMGRLVGIGQMTVAQEHILSALLKEQMYRMKAAAPKARGRARLLIAAPEGDFHELGILLAHTLARLSGVRSLYLGPNAPKDQLCETAVRYGATHILLGSTVSRKEGAKDELFSYVNFVDRQLPRSIPLWVGGRNTEDFGARLDRQLVTLGDFRALEPLLRELIGS